MKELNDVKSVLRDVLSFAKRLNPDCRPVANIGTDNGIIQIEIREMDYQDIPAFVKYFSYLIGEIKPWVKRSSFNLHINFSQDFPVLNDIRSSFRFGAKEVWPILIKGKEGINTEKTIFYPLENLELD